MKNATVKPVVKAVKNTYGTAMAIERKEIQGAFLGVAKTITAGTSATEQSAEKLNHYFNTYFACPRWMDAEAIRDNKEIQAEKRSFQDLLEDALRSKGVPETSVKAFKRNYWKRIQDKAFELAFPNEAQAIKEAKAQAKEKAKADAENTEQTTVDISPEMMEYAQLLAGACDWDKSLANKVLALAFADATKA